MAQALGYEICIGAFTGSPTIWIAELLKWSYILVCKKGYTVEMWTRSSTEGGLNQNVAAAAVIQKSSDIAYNRAEA